MEERKKQTRTVQEEMAREQKFWKQNQLWALLLFAAVMLFSLLGGSGHSVAPGPEALTLTTSMPKKQIIQNRGAMG